MAITRWPLNNTISYNCVVLLEIDTLSPAWMVSLQVGIQGGEEDVVRSYSCLPYTWDDASAVLRRGGGPRLAVDLPGGRQLGTFTLDEVGVHTWVVPSSAGRGRPSVVAISTPRAPLDSPTWAAASLSGGGGIVRRRRPGRMMLVSVEADGPTRVLKVIDADFHPIPPPALPLQQLAHAAPHSVTAHAAPHSVTATKTPNRHPRPDPASVIVDTPLLDVSVVVESLGVSLVSDQEELAYVSLDGLSTSVQFTAVEVCGTLAVSRLRSDNSVRGAEFPVSLFSPAGKTVFGTAVDIGGLEYEGSSLKGRTRETIIHHAEGRVRSPAVGEGEGDRGMTSTATQSPRLQIRSAPLAMSVSLSLWRSQRGGVSCVKRAAVAFAPMAIFAEELAIRKLIAFTQQAAAEATSLSESRHTRSLAATGYSFEANAATASRSRNHILALSVCAGSAAMLLSSCPDVLGLLSSPPPSAGDGESAMVRRRMKLYFEDLHISPIKFSISFIPAPWHHQDLGAGSDSASKSRSRNRYDLTDATDQKEGARSRGGAGGEGGGGGRLIRLALSLAQLEGAWVQLRGFELRHPLLGPGDLLKMAAGHYIRYGSFDPLRTNPALSPAHRNTPFPLKYPYPLKSHLASPQFPPQYPHPPTQLRPGRGVQGARGPGPLWRRGEARPRPRAGPLAHHRDARRGRGQGFDRVLPLWPHQGRIKHGGLYRCHPLIELDEWIKINGIHVFFG